MSFCSIADCLKGSTVGSNYCSQHARFANYVVSGSNGNNGYPVNRVKLDNSPVDINDKVWSSMFGWGVVSALDHLREVITVTFRLDQPEDVSVDFVHNGRVRQGFPKSLFWGEIKLASVPAKPRKIKKYQWLVKKPLGAPFVTPETFALAEEVEKAYPLFDVIRPINETEVVVEA